MPTLEIARLSDRHYGITATVAADCYDSARVCLERHHRSPVSFELHDERGSESVELHWNPPTRRDLAARASYRPTTEAGAVAVVVAAVEYREQLFAVLRADTGTGVDYYLMPYGTEVEDLENSIRLEISGVDAGSAEVVRKRLREKVRQTLIGDSNLPAITGVVGFEAKLILLESVEVLP